MARSTYVYVAQYAGAIICTATVKYELEGGVRHWLDDRRSFAVLSRIRVTRHYDGHPGSNYVDITSQFDWTT